MVTQKPCLLCGASVEYLKEPDNSRYYQSHPVKPEDAAEGILSIYRIGCTAKCGTYLVRGIFDDRGKLVISTTLKACLDTVDEKERQLLSRYTKTMQQHGWTPLHEIEYIERVLTGHRFAQAACDRYGLTDAEIRYSGGYDFQSPLFIVDASQQRFTLRIYHLTFVQAKPVPAQRWKGVTACHH